MNYAIILSGGVGTRLGTEIPKQYLKINGKMIISYCLETIFLCDAIDKVVIVADPKWKAEIEAAIAGIVENPDVNNQKSRMNPGDKFMGFALPGAERQLSIYCGLKYIEKTATVSDNVIIHDAARPFVTDELLKACLEEIGKDGCGGVMPVLPCKDTMYCSENGKQLDRLLNRSKIYAGQAPEVFTFGEYFEANTALLPDEIKLIRGSSEAAMRHGMKVNLIKGDERNIKITTVDDLQRMKEMLCLSK